MINYFIARYHRKFLGLTYDYKFFKTINYEVWIMNYEL